MKIFRLTPDPHEAIWGGRQLMEMGKKPKTPASDNLAESWELSFVPGSEAKTEDGSKVTEVFSREAWGAGSRDLPFFPVLTKFIDAKEKLSVQVHPSDDYALANEGQYGKTEMWYIVDSQPGCGIYAGLKRPCTPEEFSRAVEDGTVEELLAFHETKPGDVFMIPSGTIHAICGGVLLYEIQQNSTLTYRLYDYNRRDKVGNLRPLHVEKAMKVAKLEPYSALKADDEHPEIIGKCKYFITKEYCFDKIMVLSATDRSYLCITVISGKGEIEGLPCKALDSFFLPAGNGTVTLHADGAMRIITVETPGK